MLTSDTTDAPTRIKSCRITPIESRFKHCIHAYQGVQPWTRDGARLVYLGSDDDDMERGCIVVRDMASGEETPVAESTVLNFHTGAWQRWALGERAILFNATGADGRQHPALVEPRAGATVRLLDHLPGRQVRELSGDGKRAYTQVIPAQAGFSAVERVDLESGRVETLLTEEQVMAQVDDAVLDRDQPHRFSHAVPNHEESLMFVKFQPPSPFKRVAGEMPRWGVMIVLDLRTGEFWSIGDRSSGHPSWLDDDRHILNIMNPLYDEEHRFYWVVQMDARTGEWTRIIDTFIEGPGHPVLSPDAQYIATDAFTPRGDAAPIYVIHRATGIAREIARLDHAFGGGYEMGLITRGQPHPVWSPDGSSLLVNYNHFGEHMQLLMLDDFLPSVTKAE